MWLVYDAVRYLAVATPVAAAWLWSRWIQRNDAAWCAALATAVQRAGPFWIKMGQWLAHRRDVLPAALVPHLQRMQHAAPQHSFDATRTAVERAYGGRALHDVFATFNVRPLASGTIAQVHVATLHDVEGADGTEADRHVIVKVRHPHIEERFARDVRVLRTAIRLARWFGLLRGPMATAMADALANDDLDRDIFAQCDLRNEAANVTAMRAVFARNALVCVPRVLHSAADVLIETQLHGVYASDIVDARTRRLAHRLAMATYLHMVLVAGFVHADMHGGNLLYDCTHRSDRGVPRVGLVDFGTVLHLQPAARDSLRALFESLLRHDNEAVVAAMRGLMLHHGNVQDPAVIAQACADFERMFAEFDRISAARHGRCLSATTMVRAALQTFERNRLRIDATIVRLLVNIMLIDDAYESVGAHDNTIENALAFVFYDDEHGNFAELADVVLQTFGSDLPSVRRSERAAAGETELTLVAAAAAVTGERLRGASRSKRRRRV